MLMLNDLRKAQFPGRKGRKINGFFQQDKEHGNEAISVHLIE
jgi:hypothetical protein